MKILVIASESQTFRDNTFNKAFKKRMKLLSKDEIQDLKAENDLIVAPDKYTGLAYKTYLGRLKEVFNFYCKVKQNNFDVDLVILSSLYGVVKPDENIVPYWTINGELLLDTLPERLKAHIQSADKVILVLSSKQILKFANELNRLLINKKLALVSGRNIQNYIYNTDIFLNVPGVTPIGKTNEEKLLEWIKS